MIEVGPLQSSEIISEPLGKFSTLPDSSTAYQHAVSHRHDPICRVLNMELLQFYYSRFAPQLMKSTGEGHLQFAAAVVILGFAF